MIECEECEGTGKVHVLTMSSCGKPASECCGGCGYDAVCIECHGAGEIEEEGDEL